MQYLCGTCDEKTRNLLLHNDFLEGGWKKGGKREKEVGREGKTEVGRREEKKEGSKRRIKEE